MNVTSPKKVSYELLSKLFPNVSLKEDTYLKYYDDGSILYRRYEEDYAPGVIYSDIIPIRYYGPYSKQLALSIKEFLSNQSDSFYTTFLKDYDAIILAPSQAVKNASRCLIVDDYNVRIMRLQLDILLRTAIIKKYQSQFEFLGINSNIVFNHNHEFTKDLPKDVYSKELDIIRLFKICIQTGDYDILKEILNNPEIDPRIIAMQIKSKRRFEWLNELLESSIPDFTKDNIDLFIATINYTINLVKQLSPDEFTEQMKLVVDTPLTKEESINYVREFLLSIDKSKGLLNFFDQSLLNQDLLIFNPNEKEQIAKYVNETFRPEYDISSAFVSPMHKLVCIPLQNNILDIYTIVHEFIHFFGLYSRYNTVDYPKYKQTQKFLNEFPSIYFEKLIGEFLIQKGYDPKAIDCHTFLRYINSIKIANEIKSLLDFYLLKKDVSTIKPLDLIPFKDDKQRHRFLEKYYQTQIGQYEYPHYLEQYLIEYADKLINMLNNSANILDRNFSYPLGLYLSYLLDNSSNTIEMVLASADERGKLDGTEEANLNIILNYAISLNDQSPGR